MKSFNMKGNFIVFLSVFLFIIPASTHSAEIDPSFDFFTIETTHFSIHYHEGLEEVAEKVASVAEDAHNDLAKILLWEPAEKTNVVLVDNTDFANGFATHPDWLINRWTERFGLEATARLLDHNDERPDMTLVPYRWTADRLAQALADREIAFRAAAFGTGFVVATGRASDFPGFARGAFIVQEDDLLTLPRSRRASAEPDEGAHATGLAGRSLEDIERDAIRATLQQVGWNKTHASSILGISLPTLRAKVKKYGIEDGGS